MTLHSFTDCTLPGIFPQRPQLTFQSDTHRSVQDSYCCPFSEKDPKMERFKHKRDTADQKIIFNQVNFLSQPRLSQSGFQF